MLVIVNGPPTELPAMRFADSARRLGAATHAAGLAVPAFRCPPRVPGATRTIRRYPGGAVVSVSLRGRPFEDAVTDMVEGVLAANRVPESDAASVREVLRAALDGVPAEPTTRAA
jgi:hypothetical protein